LFLSYFGCDQSQVQRFLTAKSVSQVQPALLMSAFLKIPMQFLILLIGIFVFVFYQFNAPPMVFNAVEETRIAQAAEYPALQQKFTDAHTTRANAALQYVESRDDAARAQYVEAQKGFTAVREEAAALVKTTSGNTSFTDVNYVFPSFVVANMPMGIIGLIIAAIFAAAMSSISSELNALATASTI